MSVYTKETLTMPEDLRVLSTLQDVKVGHNAVLMVEEKSDEELAAELGAQGGEDGS